MQNNSLQTHFWSDGLNPHQVFQDGRTIVHQRCLNCARDFAFELDGSGWHAAYVGLLRIEHLAESVSRQWMTEECPGRPLWELDQAARMMRIPELRPGQPIPSAGGRLSLVPRRPARRAESK
jgi:hypothetical protein